MFLLTDELLTVIPRRAEPVEFEDARLTVDDGSKVRLKDKSVVFSDKLSAKWITPLIVSGLVTFYSAKRNVFLDLS